MHLRATLTEPDLALATMRQCEATLSPGDLCGSHDWCRAALTVTEPTIEWLPVLFFAETEIVGATVLQGERAGWRSGSPGHRSVRWPMGEYGYHFAPRFLVETSPRGWWEALARLFRRDHLELRSTAPDAALAPPDRTTQVLPGPPTFRLTVPGGADEWRALLRGEHRRDLDYYRRRIARNGGVWTDLRQADDPTAALATCFELHGLRIAEKGQASAYLHDRGRGFLTALAQTARDQLRVSLLAIDGQPVGANLSFLRHGHYQCFMPGWNPDQRKLDLGRQLIYHQILRGFEEGLHTIDLLGGDLPYKREFGLLPAPTTTRIRRPSRGAALRAGVVQQALRTIRGVRR